MSAKKETPKSSTPAAKSASPSTPAKTEKAATPSKAEPAKTAPKETPKVATTTPKETPKAATPAPKETPKETPKAATSTPVAVPESVLKSRKATQKSAEEKEKNKKSLRLKKMQSKRIIFHRAEKFIAEYKKQEKDMIRMKRIAKSHGNFYVEPEPKLVFVVRMRGINGLHPKPRKILQLLRLRQINNGGFIRLTKATSEMLRLVDPYVTYGYPSLKTVRELVYKRGFAKINGERIPITDNSLIEQHLGKYGVVCMEDIIHELFTVGPHFKEVNSFLWPFKLSAPTGGWNKVTTHIVEGGDAGNRETRINALVRRMN